MFRLCPTLVVAALMCRAVPAAAQDRPSEAELFGSEPVPSIAAEPATTERAAPEDQPAPPGSSDAPLDPLKVGGQIYLRAQASARERQGIAGASFGAPSLLDVYLDGRPNDRVRGFVLGRLFYDPALPESAAQPGVGTGTVSPSGTSAGSPALSSLLAPQTRAPTAVVDQLWIRFDVARRVFVTAGKQHVRWGTGRFWMPTDLLHLRRRDPLAVFDARAGTTMLKLHVPIEQRAWNFYAYAIPENLTATHSPAQLAAALRAEIVVGDVELGLGAYLRKNIAPKLAADVSTALGPLDAYGELGLLQQREVDRVSYVGQVVVAPATTASWLSPGELDALRLQQTVDATYPVHRADGYRPQAVVGLSYGHPYNDGDQWTIGAEYFYNGLGYDSPLDYAGLILPHTRPLQNAATFFYLGKHYAALYASLPAPFSWDLHSFQLAALGNLSDQSFIVRFDYALTFLTHLRLEAFAAGHVGRPSGELRFGFEYPTLEGTLESRPPATFDVGIALRLAI